MIILSSIPLKKQTVDRQNNYSSTFIVVGYTYFVHFIDIYTIYDMTKNNIFIYTKFYTTRMTMV